jgi:deoxyribonuclease V
VHTFSEELEEMQRKMASKIVSQDVTSRKISIVGGADVAYEGIESLAVVSIHAYDSLESLGSNIHTCQIIFPYISGLLAFREAEAILSAAKPFSNKMDLLIVDGHGVAHPRRCGLASFVGLFLGIPTIGVAKELLCGEAAPFHDSKFADVIHNGDLVARAFKRSPSARPIYISVGHKISLEKACQVVEHTTTNHRVPEPIFEAHRLGRKEDLKRGSGY